jgi:8-oxo-dGTP pyrophosphatase MutT (NUDIX family)
LLTADELRQRFAHTALPSDPTNVIEYPGSRHWPASLQQQLQSTLIPAGVLIPIFSRPDSEHGLSLLLTQRAADLKHHAGQVSFPGGRMEPDDPNVGVTALRETQEEVGIGVDRVSVIGYLEPMPTITGYAVTPVVGLIASGVEPVPDHKEVEFAFEVPLTFLLQPGNQRVVQRELHGKSFPMVEFHYAGHRIWGATAMMILEFIKVLKKN